MMRDGEETRICEALGGLFGTVSVTDPGGVVIASGRAASGFDCRVGALVWDMPSLDRRGRAGLRRAIRLGASGKPARTNVRLRQEVGRATDLDVRVAPIRQDDTVVALVVAATDVSQQVRRERARGDEDARIRLAMEAAQVQTWEVDLRNGTVRSGRHVRPLIESGPRFRNVDDFVRLLSPEDRAAARLSLETAVATDSEYRIDHRIPVEGRPDVWIRSVGRVVRDKAGAAVSLRGIAVDVTKRMEQEIAAKAASDEIASRERHLRSILDTVPSAMVVADDAGRITMFGRAAQDMFGYGAEEVLGQGVGMLFPGRDRALRANAIAGRLAGENGEAQGRTVEARARRGDGSNFPIELSIGVTDGEGPASTTLFMRDITDRKEADARLQKLNARLAHGTRGSAMGQLATSLAHELNQPLSAATNYVGVARVMMDNANADPNGLRDALEQASRQLIRAGGIIAHMRDLVAGTRPERTAQDPVGLVEEALQLGLAGDVRGDVELVRRFPRNLPHVLADRIPLQQVVINLVRNAIESMAGHEAPRVVFTMRHDKAEGVVRFSVRDHGTGIAPSVRARLFEAFTSTKSSGLGLGLSISRGIVEANGGRIWAAPARPGTTFHFTLKAQLPPLGEGDPFAKPDRLRTMSQPVTVIHPAAVVHRPDRARRERLDVVAMATPARLRDVSPKACRRADDGPGGLLVVDGEDGVWKPVACLQGAPVPKEAFLDFLRGEDLGRREYGLRMVEMMLARTPLVALAPFRPPGLANAALMRGGEVAVSSDASRIRHDGRDGAPAELRAFLDARIRLCGKGVLMRVSPMASLMCFLAPDGTQSWLASHAFGADLSTPDELERGMPPVRVDRVDQAVGAWHRTHHAGMLITAGTGIPEMLRSGNPEMLRDHDATALANQLPGNLRVWLARLDPLHPGAAALLDAGFRDRLESLALRGLTGTIPEAEAGAVLGSLGSAMLAYAEEADSADTNAMHGLACHALNEVLPRVSGPVDVPGADAEALGSLAP